MAPVVYTGVGSQTVQQTQNAVYPRVHPAPISGCGPPLGLEAGSLQTARMQVPLRDTQHLQLYEKLLVPWHFFSPIPGHGTLSSGPSWRALGGNLATFSSLAQCMHIISHLEVPSTLNSTK